MSDPGGENDRAVILVRHAAERAIRPSPDALDECARWLEEAVEEARKYPCRPAHRADLLRRKLALLRALLRQASCFYQGWLEIRNSLAAGYTARGTSGGIEPPPRLCLQG